MHMLGAQDKAGHVSRVSSGSSISHHMYFEKEAVIVEGGYGGPSLLFIVEVCQLKVRLLLFSLRVETQSILSISHSYMGGIILFLTMVEGSSR